MPGALRWRWRACTGRPDRSPSGLCQRLCPAPEAVACRASVRSRPFLPTLARGSRNTPAGLGGYGPARLHHALRPCSDCMNPLTGRALILQLSLRTGFALMALPVTVLGHGLMDAPPQRPAEEMIEHYAGRTLQAANELADLAHAEGDQSSRLRRPLLCDVTALSFTRRAARKPKASMASVMCRYQPCQERIS